MRGNMGKKLQEELLRGLMEDTISLERTRTCWPGVSPWSPVLPRL